MKQKRLKDTKLVKYLVARNDAKYFYSTLLRRMLKSGILTKDMSILVICGTRKDETVFNELGFTEVTISNLDSTLPTADVPSPYNWSFQDAENLQYPNEHFDFVVVNAGLHHCHSPHRALLEMYRVARHGILIIEARESTLMKLALRLGFAEEYEVCTVVMEGFKSGGVRNTLIPNYIYRWTEREVAKTIASYAPHVKHYIQFHYDLLFPFSALLNRKSIYLTASLILYPMVRIVSKLFQKQSNLFAFVIRKPKLPKVLVPWLRLKNESIQLNMRWVKGRYEIGEKH